MNWCQPHWDKLREYVERKGLTEFVPKDGKGAARALIDGQVKSDAKENFDPLMGSWLRINMAMLESPALKGRMLQCPMCILVEDGQPDKVDNWLDGVTDNALDFAREKGWIKTN